MAPVTVSELDADGTLAAQARLETLFRALDRLTPDELARIGYLPGSDEEQEVLLDAVDEAAKRTGRTELVDRARSLAWTTVMRRYGEGTLHPTWVTLNWALSSGTVQDRVAIAETLANAAAAVVVEDALEPEVAEAFRLDAADVLMLAGGMVSEGSLARALSRPEDPELGSTLGRMRIRVIAAAALVLLASMGLVSGVLGVPLAIAVLVVRWPARRLRRGSLPSGS
jgi:hypothetical protein